MRHSYLLITALSSLLIGCKQNSVLLPSVEFGQSETEWKQARTNLLGKGTLKPSVVRYDTLHEYNWQLEGADIRVYVSLNSDPIHDGPLRMVTYDLTTEVVDLDTTALGGTSEYPGEDIARFCYESKVDMVKQLLNEKYGKPTSVKVLSTGDTVFRYERPEFDLDLLKASPIPDTMPLVGQVFDYKYRTAQVNVFAKDYAKQREDLISAMQSKLRPEDVVRIHFPEPNLTQALAANGNTYQALQIAADYELGASPYERRTIESVKGDLQIMDRFGDIVFKQVGVEYVPNNPIQPTTFYKANKGWTLYLTNQPETRVLKEAVTMKKQLKVEFKPTAVYYTNGSVLK